ncbi:MAG: NBR1-Ig-like domain-containing protein [Chloroflexota bacterium]
MNITKSYRFIVLALAVLLASCNLPSSAPGTESANNAVLTAAAQTVEASLTQAAIANPPAVQATATKPAALPTATLAGALPATLPAATATQNCDKAEFVTDVTIPDGTDLDPNESFVKTWRLKNIGACSWTPSYAVVFNSGDAMSGPATQALTGNVNPGQTVDISVNLKAPAASGAYKGWWGLRNASNATFAQFYVDIKVAGGGSTPAFAVTSVNMSVAGACGNFTVTANITANGAGNVTYKWVRSDGATDTNVHDPVVFAAAGTKSVSTQWFVSAAGSHWMDIYVDSPNHQQFGRANFSCP